MMDNEEKFFSGIEDTLYAYEDAYKPGAWEAFDQQRKRKRMAVLYYRIAGVAAMLLLFSYAAVRFFAETPQTAQYTKTKVNLRQPKKAGKPVIVQPGPATAQPDAPAITEKDHTLISTDQTFDNITSITNTPVKTPAQQPKNIQPAKTQADPILKSPFTSQGNVIANNLVAPVNNNNLPVQKTMAPDSATGKAVQNVLAGDAIAQAQTDRPKRNAPVTRPIYDSLVNDRKEQVMAKISKKESNKPLTYSVVVQPGMGNQKVNFGTGVEVAYKLTDNISISSGVAYSSLNAAANGSTAPFAAEGSVRQVQGVNLAVSGVEVPIGIQYKTNSGYYVSAGVVGMQVLSNNLQYNYIAQVTVPQATFNMAAGKEVQALVATTEAKTENSREQIKNVLGFYMLSVGKKKAVGNNQLNFGPFMRIPFGAVSSENIRLMQAGVRVGFDF